MPVAPIMSIISGTGEPLEWSGLQSAKMRLQLGAADELDIELPAQDVTGAWRLDMPAWQVGSKLTIGLGYDGKASPIQSFEIVSISTRYGAVSELPMVVIRGVSELVRAARNKAPRTFPGSNDYSVVQQLCDSYGWRNGVAPVLADLVDYSSSSLFKRLGRTKEGGDTDLKLLKEIAAEAGLGGPRLEYGGSLVMPEPDASNAPTFVRGIAHGVRDPRHLLSFTPSREGGDSIQLSIIGWDPEGNRFVEYLFEASEYGGDPRIVYQGPPAVSPIAGESTTRGLTLQVVKFSGTPKKERRDVIASKRYLNETDAIALADRYFDFREKLGRWSDAEVEGDATLAPYKAIIIDGEMANMDRGYWLPLTVEHNMGSDGWQTNLRMIRVVEAPSVSSQEASSSEGIS